MITGMISEGPMIALADEDHSYNHVAANEYVRFLGGFTARRMKSLSGKCAECRDSMTKSAQDADPADTLITIKSKGSLLYPSEKLANLL